ncbi:MAG: flagellar biosynthesis protein FlhF [Clostridiaceae bacterium]|nr:flagellar biosynthesis protein FlhF [Clostridiaceae bacterium]
MKIRRYTCKDMQEALLKVKMDLGSEAVIMNSRKVKPKGLKGLFSKPMIEVVAAIDDDYVRPSRTSIYNKNLSEIRNVVKSAAAAAGSTLQNNAAQPKSHNVNESSKTENSQIAELENKVKNMEETLKKIYQSLQGKEAKENASLNEPTDQNVKKDTAEYDDQSQWKPLSNEAVKTTIMPQNKIADKIDSDYNLQISEQESSPDDFSLLKRILFNQDLEPKLIEKILDKIKERGTNSLEETHNLAHRILTVLLGKPEPLTINEKRPHVAIFIGPTGVGKTTTLAKIAAEFSLNQQKNVGLITADTYRIAAIEQLKTYAEILNIPLNVVYSPEEIKDAVNQLAEKDLILIDTAGRSYRNKPHFDELKALISAVDADETFLVLSCNTSPRAIKETLEYYAFIKNFKLIFTKLDESPTFGVIFNARYLTGKPLSYTTAGQSVPDDLDFANPKQLTEFVLSEIKNNQ